MMKTETGEVHQTFLIWPEAKLAKGIIPIVNTAIKLQ